MPLQLRYAARSHPGLVREGNEDSGFAGPHLLVVADGMGGHVAGEVASAVAVTTLAQLDDQPSRPDDLLGMLGETVDAANLQLRLLVTGDPNLRGMGTTLTALLWSGSQLGLVHVGDSRAYLLRDGAIEQITHDHTFVQSLIDEGRISQEQAAVHPQRSLITRALDGRETVESDLSLREARAGDRYLLCSDGLSGVVREETLAQMLTEVEDRQEVCDVLIDLALRGGGPDNITCIVADVVDADESAVDVDTGSPESVYTAESAFVGAAARERAETGAHPTPAATESAADPHAELGDSPRGRLWGLLLGLAIVLVLVIVGWTAYAATRNQYYVGADPDGNVAIYRGVPHSVLGVSLSSVTETEQLRISALPDYDRSRVQERLDAADLDDARRIVANLREVARSCARPTPTPTPSSATRGDSLTVTTLGCEGATP